MFACWSGREVTTLLLLLELLLEVELPYEAVCQSHAPLEVQGVQEKSCIFTIHCLPSLAYIAVRYLQSSTQCECTVTAPIGW